MTTSGSGGVARGNVVERVLGGAFALSAVGLALLLWPRWSTESDYRVGQVLSLHPTEDVPGRLEAYLRAADGGGPSDGVPELRVAELWLRRAAASESDERDRLLGLALEAADEAVELRPLDGRARVARARAFGMAGLREAAADDLRRAVALAPRHPGVSIASLRLLLPEWERSRDARDLAAGLRAGLRLRAMGERPSARAVTRILAGVPGSEWDVVEALRADDTALEGTIEWLGEADPVWVRRLQDVSRARRR